VLENVRFLAACRRAGLVDEAAVERAWESVRDGDQRAAATAWSQMRVGWLAISRLIG
jgi:hypothetical protein